MHYMRRFRFVLVVLSLALGASLAVQTAGGAESAAVNTLSGRLVTDGGSFELKLSSKPQPIPLNELFELTIEVLPAKKVKDPNPFWLSINATMPAHKHGMNTRPRVEDLGNGRFVIRGMLLHMAGDWEISLDVAKGGIREQAKISLNVE